ncbi:uncharacterized protein Z519_07421 [Cladophialophora bantiana CBS 173.52]|uniref:Aminotransferase class I/classII large domain-containing protein n=1 Tax=Cladophialophora bantiana (strain ATCC 10958 / CBS 173.52 / CDC B-1940 / NIH 8579) TaxID=1442370 RepID=A0A0D2G125_CLAB1|nr:uncharacterized protein Z519_07421 [Cladophialophora bantiana CBS 173.52]KIW92437.1 hypothetical protein Z519_07421 [Cladophialophora bantiana CBS 173.52]
MSGTSLGRSALSRRAQECANSPESPQWHVYSDQWHPSSNPGGYVNVGVAENSLMHAELEAYIQTTTHVPQTAFTYGDGPLGSKRLRKAVARFLNRRLHPVLPLEMDHVIVTNGVSHAIEHTSWAFSFIPDISLRPGVEALTVSFGSVDPMSVEAVAKYEDTILAAEERGIRAKALMLCSPHNPLGRCYSREALLAYMRLCEKYQIHLVSDEIYAFSAWKNRHDSYPPPVEFTSVLSIAPEGIINPLLVHVLWGMSKGFGANGLRVGYIISQYNEAFREALLEVAIYSYATSVAEHIAAKILEDDPWVDNYIQTNQTRLAESYSLVVEFLNKHNIPYTPGANAAFFLWVDLGKAYLERHPEQRRDAGEAQVDDGTSVKIMQLLMKNKVFLGGGAVFGAETPGLFRIVFSHARSYIEEALKRITKAMGDMEVE